MSSASSAASGLWGRERVSSVWAGLLTITLASTGTPKTGGSSGLASSWMFKLSRSSLMVSCVGEDTTWAQGKQHWDGLPQLLPLEKFLLEERVLDSANPWCGEGSASLSEGIWFVLQPQPMSVMPLPGCGSCVHTKSSPNTLPWHSPIWVLGACHWLLDKRITSLATCHSLIEIESNTQGTR